MGYQHWLFKVIQWLKIYISMSTGNSPVFTHTYQKKLDTFFTLFTFKLWTSICSTLKKVSPFFFFPCEQNNLYSTVYYCAFLYGIHTKENDKGGLMLLKDGEMEVAYGACAKMGRCKWCRATGSSYTEPWGRSQAKWWAHSTGGTGRLLKTGSGNRARFPEWQNQEIFLGTQTVHR